MNCENKRKEITAEQKKAIEKALTNGDRIELIPNKEGIKVMLVRKNELKVTK